MRSYAPFEPIVTKFCMWGRVGDVLTDVKFYGNRLSCFKVTGPPKCHFLYLTFIALTTVSALPCCTVIFIIETCTPIIDYICILKAANQIHKNNTVQQKYVHQAHTSAQALSSCEYRKMTSTQKEQEFIEFDGFYVYDLKILF